MSDRDTKVHREVKDERDEEHQRDPNSHVDPKYLRHHDAGRIEENIRNEKMRPVKFPT